MLHLLILQFTVMQLMGIQASTGDEWNSLNFRLPGTQYEGELFTDETEEFNPMDYTVGLVSMITLLGLFNHHTA